MKNYLLTLALLAGTFSASAQLNIIPKPLEVKESKGSAIVDASTVVVVTDPALQSTADFLNGYLSRFYNLTLNNGSSKAGSAIVLSVKKDASKPEGAYTLTVAKNKINIQGANPNGVFYGVQTLVQLLPVEPASRITIPNVVIKDQPRFKYRGVHLDVSRHFSPVDFIKKYIDYLALHKMNYFHWHLTDDQGWRIEIKKYPKLTQVGAWRNGTSVGHYPGTGNDRLQYGGFYTQEEVKDVVKYAADRFITVVPELEMPGHASAAIAAYPELSCFPNESTKVPKGVTWSGDTTGKKVQQTWGVFPDVFAPTEKTFAFLQDVIDELLPLFPSKYIHIGGDECPKESWKRSAFCQQLMKEKGLKDEHELQSYFIQRIEKYINSKGRTIIGWDEILEGGLAPNAIVMSWRGEEGGIAAAKDNHYVIMTPNSHMYFDHSQMRGEDSVTIGGYLNIKKVYSYEPVPASLPASQAKYILGGQANLWTEYMKNPKKVEYMLFPRIGALSEVLWTSKEQRDWADFEPRIRKQIQRYELWGVQHGIFQPDADF